MSEKCDACFHGEICEVWRNREHAAIRKSELLHCFMKTLGTGESCEHFIDSRSVLLLRCNINNDEYKVYKICPVSQNIEIGNKWGGKIVETECQRCPYETCDSCCDIGYIKGQRNIVNELTTHNLDYILRIQKYFGKNYFSSREEAEQYIAEMDAKGE